MTSRQKKLIENFIRRIVREEVNISEKRNLDQPFWVIEKGGSIGSSSEGWMYIGKGRIVATCDTKEEASEYAKHRRSGLSNGERSYYGMGYIVVPANKRFVK